jgi:hypothetical protein
MALPAILQDSYRVLHVGSAGVQWGPSGAENDAGACVAAVGQVAFEAHPLAGGLTLWNALRVAYLAIFGLYWLYNLVHLCIDLREAAVIAHFTQVPPPFALIPPRAEA